MLKTRKSILALIIALFVIASFGIASADEQIDGMMTNNGVALPLDVPAFAGGLTANLDNYLNPGGLGDTLLYNYFNARKSMQTFFTVVNTSNTAGQRVRLRFREAADVLPNGVCTTEEPRGSFEVLDFDICLSHNDMWSGYVTFDSVTGGAMLCTLDTDTFVYDGTNGANVFPSTCVPFKFGAANGQALGNITADDTLEGYFEIIGERELIPEPLSCWPDSSTHSNSPDLVGTDVPNVLFGNAALVDSSTGAMYTYDATAIADFAATDIFSSPTTSTPTLKNAGDSILGVNYILTREHLFSVYDLSGASATEFIVTEPTKALTQICGTDNDIFDDDRAQFTIWDDKENSVTTLCAFSPCTTSDNHLPFEVNIIALNASAAVDSTVAQQLVTGYTFGWFDINLNAASSPLSPLHEIVVTDQSTPAITTTTMGWPVLGLTLLDVNNGMTTGTFKMQSSTDIFSTPARTIPQGSDDPDGDGPR